MCACENMRDIRANGADAHQCADTFRDAISAPYKSVVSCALISY